MKIIGCLNMREKDGGQSSVTVGCVYLPVSFFNACTSDYLRTERLFLQRPISPQMASRCFSYFAALLLEISELLGVAYTQIRNPDSNLSLLGRS